MQYMFLIYADESTEPKPGTAEFDAMMGAYHAFTEETQKRGIYHHAAPLEPVSAATTVRVRAGKTTATDGPFAETKEQLGGYYLLECKNLDEALELAAKIPTAKHGSIEVRPVMPIPEA